MKKKTAVTDAAVKPGLTVKNWWTRAIISFVTGLFFLWLTYLVPSSFLAICLGIIGFVAAIVLPIIFGVIAVLKETDQI